MREHLRGLVAFLSASPDLYWKRLKAEKCGVLADLVGLDVQLSEGVAGRTDGGLVAGFRFEGADLELASSDRIAEPGGRLAEALRVLRGGDVVHWDVMRRPVTREARAESVAGGALIRALDAGEPEAFDMQEETFVFVARAPEGRQSFLQPDEPMAEFEELLSRFGGFLAEDGASRVSRLRGAELFTALARSTRFRGHSRRPLAVTRGMRLDQALSVEDLETVSGDILRIGEEHFGLVGMSGFGGETEVGFAENAVRRLPYPMRFVARFLRETDKATIDRMNWKKTGHGFSGLDLWNVWQEMKKKNSPSAEGEERGSALGTGELMENVDEARKKAHQGMVFGLVSAWIWVGGKDAAEAGRRAREVRGALERVGLTGAIEPRRHLISAYEGSIAGNARSGLRVLQLPAQTFGGMVPLGTVWRGDTGEEEAPVPMRPDLPELMTVCRRSGESFAFSPFCCGDIADDIGSAVVIGPAGAGKSVFLNKLIWRLLAWQGTRIFSMDVGRSQGALARALGKRAAERTLGETSGRPMAPFGELAGQEIAAEQALVEEMLHQQKVEITPRVTNLISAALRRVAELDRDRRRLSTVIKQVQSEDLRAALRVFEDGPYAGYLNGVPGRHDDVLFYLFEIQKLLSMDERISAPVVVHLLGRMERLLNGRDLRYFFIEEFHRVMRRSRFLAEGVEDTFKRYRKHFGSMVLVSHDAQSLAEGSLGRAVNAGVGCRIALPARAAASSEDEIRSYEALGFTPSEIESIARAKPKEEYLIKKGPDQAVWIRLRMSDMELAILGCSAERVEEITEFQSEHGERWLVEWAVHRGVARLEAETFFSTMKGFGG